MSFNFITEKLQQQHSSARYRQRHCVSTQNARELVMDGKCYLNFSSNDYLGLNHHPNINKALQEGAERFGTGASASSLVTGFNYAHQALEEKICLWLNKPKCLLYSSGFAANSGVLSALGNKDSQFYLDKLSHASLIDGSLSSGAKVRRFRHNDMEQLEGMLSQSLPENNVVISEGVFSMDGDSADVAQLSSLSRKHNAWLYMDDAHSLGVIGEQGQGSSSCGDIDIVMGTFGKALATSGAFIACDDSLYDYLVNFSRHYIYSTAISPAIAWATIESINLTIKEQWRRDKIQQLTEHLVTQLDSTIKIVPSNSSINALVLGDEQTTLSVGQKLRNKGIWLTAIRPPTVPVNSSRLRVTITSSHKEKDINYLVECLHEVLL